jgi:hypothetical protein
VKGWIAHDRKNGWEIPKPKDINANLRGAIVRDEILAPGLIDIPVCKAEEAFANWKKHAFTMEFEKAPFPCNA